MAVITISRQFGAGGITLGESVAKKLGYAFYYDEIIEMIAERAKVSEEGVAAIENESGGRLMNFISGIVPRSLVETIFDTGKEYMEKNEYVDLLSTIMKKIAAEGNAVVVGRAGAHFLQDQENVYHVLIVADQKDRVKFMQKHYDLSPDKALEAVKKEDSRRKILFRILGIENYDLPDIYHLVLNMSKIDLQLACELICELPTTQADPQQGVSERLP